MHYIEHPFPASLMPFVAAVWTLDAGGVAADSLHHDAVPDGCVELITRHAGTSAWEGEQPNRFVAGLCTVPARLRMSGDARFTGIRLWPWAWNIVGAPACPTFHNRWIPLEEGTPAWALAGEDGDIMSRLLELFSALPRQDIGADVPHASSPGDLAQRTGRNPRSLQRWFSREIGLAPRQYYRLLRVQKSIAEDRSDSIGGAEKAVAAGYADQSHMTREFQRFAKSTPRKLANSARGPFVDRAGD